MRRRDFLIAAAGGTAALMTGKALTGKALAKGTPDDPFRIYRITYRGRTPVEEGFDTYMAANGISVDFIERDAARDTSKLPGFVEEIRELQPDLVYTWGTGVTLGAAGKFDADNPADYITDIPIVFALVSAPVKSGLVPSRENPGRNLTGAVHVVPTETQLRAMASYRPFTKLGVLYTPTEPNSVAIVEELGRLKDTLGFELITRTFRIGDDGKPTADGVEDLIGEIKADGAEWLYLLPDTFLGTVYDRVAPAALAEKLPTFGAAELAVRQGGALVALVSRYYSVGQLAASKAIAILTENTAPRDIPIETLSRFSLIINMDIARQLELYPPIEMLNYAEVITG